MVCGTAIHQEDLEPTRFTCNGSNLLEASVATDTSLVGTGSTANPLGVTGLDVRSTFLDDMFGVLGGQWVTRVTTNGRAPISKDNGWFRLTTGATATNEESIDWGDVLQFTNTKQPNYNTRIQLDSIADVEVELGLIGVATNDYIRFFYDASDAVPNWRLQSSNAGAATSVTTAIPVTTDEVELSWVFADDSTIDFFIDGAAVGSIGINVPTNSLQPYITVRTEVAASKILDVDFVEITQDRV